MDNCDPYQCMPQGNQTNPKQVVDCFAAGFWQHEYQRKFPAQHAYPHECPPVFLDCGTYHFEAGHPIAEHNGFHHYRALSAVDTGAADGGAAAAVDGVDEM